MTPIDFYLIKKGSLHLSGIRFYDFSYIIYLYTQKLLDLVVLKVCKKKNVSKKKSGINLKFFTQK